jgi:hypothetical protein
VRSGAQDQTSHKWLVAATRRAPGDLRESSVEGRSWQNAAISPIGKVGVHETAGSRPVFVDPSGRRGRTVRRLTWAVGTLVGLYAVLVVVALVMPVGLNRLAVPGLGPLLPGPVAAPAQGDEGSDGNPQAAGDAPSAGAPTGRAAQESSTPGSRSGAASTHGTPSSSATRPRASPSATTAPPDPTTRPPRPTGPPSPTTGPTPTAQPSPSATDAPGSSDDAPGRTGVKPTKAPTAPKPTHAPNPRPTKG